MANLLPARPVFDPSEEDLVNYYLINKNQNPVANDEANNGFALIRELNLYEHSPYNMPNDTCYLYGERGSKRHWYCYTARVMEEGETRLAVEGSWRRRGTLNSVMNRARDAVVGTRRTFWFYAGNSVANAEATNWVMYEYSLLDHQMGPFVVCRLFTKPHDNSPEVAGSQVPAIYNFLGPSYFGNPIFGNQHNQYINRNGVQLIGNVAPDVLEASFYSENLTEPEDNDTPPDSEKRNDEPKKHDPTEAAPGSNSKPSAQIPPETQRLQPLDDSIQIEPWTAEQYRAAIEEEDFIELDDLVD